MIGLLETSFVCFPWLSSAIPRVSSGFAGQIPSFVDVCFLFTFVAFAEGLISYFQMASSKSNY